MNETSEYAEVMIGLPIGTIRTMIAILNGVIIDQGLHPVELGYNCAAWDLFLELRMAAGYPELEEY